ncbi:hypothetical protein [Thalassospira marina]|uniref:Uncharacterized protein n=1 Tax=Thalassospira marina TaxID=2048283 RepID=A0A2N3KUM7_9PROT|nr:hypothetical protein [Thalassospira marina]PKR54259.1 hypothetical protein COO20_08915 [Thalassospira marina]
MTRYAKTNIPGHPSIIVGKPYLMSDIEPTKQGGEMAIITTEQGNKILATIGHEGDTWTECSKDEFGLDIGFKYLVVTPGGHEACAFDNPMDAAYAAGRPRYAKAVSTIADDMHHNIAEHEDETLAIWEITDILTDSDGRPEFLKICQSAPRQPKTYGG